MKSNLEALISALIVTAALVTSWVVLALLTGVFFGIARHAYNWVV